MSGTESGCKTGCCSRPTAALLGFAGLAGSALAADLWTKDFMFRRLFQPGAEWQEPEWLAEGVFGFQPSFNPGALFGMGAGFSWLFASVGIVFLLLIVAWLCLGGGWRDRWLVVAAGFVSAGIAGNLHDRLGWGMREGFPESARTSVRDWILFRLEGVPFFDPWPNFNLADSFLVVGAGLILVHSFLVGRREKHAAAAPAEDVAAGKA
jgi:signal peptidase II